MRRELDLNAVSDGKLYRQSDMVKAGCNDCKGCSDCCRGMGDSIVLDPFDVYQLCSHLEQNFETLLSYALELRMADGLILPNLKMAEKEEQCPFLNIQGRCSIHAFRPGFCRMFPLGRIYEEDCFHYFLQVHECRQNPKTKVKISKWLGISRIQEYERFVLQWQTFLKKAEKIAAQFQEESAVKNVCMFILKTFYLTPYKAEADFYEQFEERLKKAEIYFF